MWLDCQHPTNRAASLHNISYANLSGDWSDIGTNSKFCNNHQMIPTRITIPVLADRIGVELAPLLGEVRYEVGTIEQSASEPAGHYAAI